jgi:acetylornithine/succinyldiaminopimelate/putrescine aminotransferase
LSSSLYSPIGETGLTKEMIKEELPYLNNKVCLSNFVSERFLQQTKDIFELMPKDLRHGFTASGQSECVDKIAKTLWWNDEKKSGYRMVTFENHFFGTGSFLARSLSESNDTFFPVTHLSNPTSTNTQELLSNVDDELSKGDVLAVWIEPIMQQTMDKISEGFLTKLRKLCTKHGTNLVFNETVSSFYRYNSDTFFASENMNITPDAAMIYMGGQSGMVFTRKEKFLEKPLMMISTWDGDEFSLSKYHKAAMRASEDKSRTTSLYKEFETKLNGILEKHQMQTFNVKNGCGSFEGNFPTTLTNHFKYKNGRYLVAPNLDDINKFLEKGFS